MHRSISLPRSRYSSMPLHRRRKCGLMPKSAKSRGCLMLDWDAIGALFPANMIDTMFASYCQLFNQLAARDWRQLITLPLPEEQQQKRQ